MKGSQLIEGQNVKLGRLHQSEEKRNKTPHEFLRLAKI